MKADHKISLSDLAGGEDVQVLPLGWSSACCIKGGLSPLTCTLYEACKVHRAANVTCVLHNILLILGEALSMVMSKILSTMGHSVAREPGATPKWGLLGKKHSWIWPSWFLVIGSGHSH